MNLLNRLGVRPPPPDGFDLINVVQPVSLVDTDIVLPVSSSSILMDLPFTAGYLLNPAAATALADTGAQTAGPYQVEVMIGDDGQNVTWAWEIVRRNAANNADIWSILGGQSQSGNMFHRWSGRIQLNLNERLIVRNKTALGATGLTVSAQIWLVAG